MEVHGVPDYVICAGRVVVEEGEVRAVAGVGKFVPTPVYSPAVYGRVNERDRANAPKKVTYFFSLLMYSEMLPLIYRWIVHLTMDL